MIKGGNDDEDTSNIIVEDVIETLDAASRSSWSKPLRLNS